MTKASGQQAAAPSDAELVALLRADPAAGTAALYDRYGRLVYSVALRVAQDGGAAEEITQDVFVRCWRTVDRFNPEQGSLSAWLLAITHNRSIDEVRSRRGQEARRTTSDAELEHASIDPGFDAALVQDEVQQALGHLPGPQREVIELLYWAGLSRREIAEQLRLPLGTVHTRLRLGMEKLREALARLIDDE